VGEHQVERTQTNAACPRWGWSGAREIVPPLWSEAELRRVAGLPPSRQSSIENIVAELHATGGRYHRNLHQGLGRRGQSGCKRCGTFLFVWASCRRGLKLYPPQLRMLFSEGFLECRSAAGQLDVDPVAFYSADKTAIDVVSETASDVRHTLARVGRTDEANLIGEICAAADTIVPLLWNLDTATDGDVVIDAGSAGPVPADNSADPFIAIAPRSGVCAAGSSLRSPTSGAGMVPTLGCHWAWSSRNFAISGDERPVGPSPPTP
jgi:hypothetical protein